MGFFDWLTKGSEQEVSQTQQSRLPDFAQPYWDAQMGMNQDVWSTPRQYFPGQTYADMSPERAQGLSMAADLARGGAPGTQAASDYVNSVLAGDYLNPSALMQGAQGAINRYLPGVSSAWNSYGGSGGALANAAMGDVIANAVSNQYGAERGRMAQAAQMAPGLDRAAYMPAQMLGQIGREYEAFNQLGIAEDMARYAYNRDDPYVRSGASSGLTQGLLPLAGQDATSTQTMYGPSGLSQLAGIGLAAAGLGMGNPMAALGGMGMMGGGRGGGGGGGFTGQASSLGLPPGMQPINPQYASWGNPLDPMFASM